MATGSSAASLLFGESQEEKKKLDEEKAPLVFIGKRDFKNSSSCKACGKKFNFALRPHHCRICAQSFCNACSKNSIQKQRVCDACCVRHSGVVQKVVIIVGAGYVGLELAKALEKTGKFNVIVFDRKNYFLHNIASPRCIVDEEFAGKVMMPYTNVLKHGSILPALVEKVDLDGVHVHDIPEPVKADYIVIATGASYAFPFKVAHPDVQGNLKRYAEVRELVAGKKKIVVVGGGIVGLEIASEVAELPNKDITIIHSRKKFVSEALPDKFHETLFNQVKAAGIKMVMGERCNDVGTNQDFSVVVQELLSEGRDAYLRKEFDQTDPNGPPTRTLLDLIAKSTSGRVQELDAVEPEDLTGVPPALARKICGDLRNIESSVSTEGLTQKQIRWQNHNRKKAALLLSYVEGPVDVTTNRGTIIENVDLVFRALGTPANTECAKAFDLNRRRVAVNEYMQVLQDGKAVDNIFCIGDAAARDAMNITNGRAQATYLAQALVDRENGKEPGVIQYEDAGVFIMSFGKKGGVGVLPSPLGVVGGSVVSRLKSDMFVGKFRKELNLPADDSKDDFSMKKSDAQIAQIARVFGVTEEFVRQVEAGEVQKPSVPVEATLT